MCLLDDLTFGLVLLVMLSSGMGRIRGAVDDLCDMRLGGWNRPPTLESSSEVRLLAAVEASHILVFIFCLLDGVFDPLASDMVHPGRTRNSLDVQALSPSLHASRSLPDFGVNSTLLAERCEDADRAAGVLPSLVLR